MYKALIENEEDEAECETKGIKCSHTNLTTGKNQEQGTKSESCIVRDLKVKGFSLGAIE